ncbi:hypothetical protein GCM10009116_06660 [Brevundimonas basaltis]|uniref:EF-hand domain-containing protein n=1 Tax=Brevundimonas basaltis TaxID=472166 RepID=A0A7W8MH86_9CAUL|nr:EF-hand domain-containing protein [Brevundimonas basaltis]MBB5292409.1 hypothetical protein [Brevundimonas basaltis]
MNKTLLAGALAALTLAAGGMAVAQQSPDRPQARAFRADADGDQRLSRAEVVDTRIQRLTAADSDEDGSVTRDEMRAARQARRAERADARFDRLDADDDGAISKAEFDARRERRSEDRAERAPRHLRRGQNRAAAPRAGRMADRGPVVIAEARARAEAGFARMDADSDGYITAAERQAARADRRQHRRERMMERREARRSQQASPSTPASE